MDTTSDTLLRLLRIERRARPQHAAQIEFWTQLIISNINNAPALPVTAEGDGNAHSASTAAA
jgi:hypothetical protein